MNVLRTYRLTHTQSWLDAHIDAPESFSSSHIGTSLSSHSVSKLPSPPSHTPIGPSRLQSRHSKHCLPSKNPDTSNGCQDEDMSFNISSRNQDKDASFDIGNGNHSMDVCFDIDNRNHDDDASIDIVNGNQARDRSFKVHNGIQNGRDAIDVVDAQVFDLARAFQSLGTEGTFELVCIYTALYPIHVNCFLDVGCIPKYAP